MDLFTWWYAIKVWAQNFGTTSTRAVTEACRSSSNNTTRQYIDGRKVSDTRPLTKQMYGFAVRKHREWIETGAVNSQRTPNTQVEFTDYLNECFHRNKSNSTMMRFIRNSFDYNALPNGPFITDPIEERDLFQPDIPRGVAI